MDIVTPVDESRVFAKVAWRLLPILTVAYVFNYLDRNNIGFAALTMNRQIGLTATEFGRGAGMLFVGYCFLEVPSNMILYRVGARKWLAQKGFDPLYGARPLARVIQENIKKPLAEDILFGKLEKGGTVRIDLDREKDQLTFEVVESKSSPREETVEPVDA